MERFLNGTQEAWDDLARRASRACVAITGCRLPPGCQPGIARIGFEVHPGEVILFVDKGIRYHGNSPALDEWLRNGEVRFRTLEDLRNWLRQEVGPVLADVPWTPVSPVPAPPAPRPQGNVPAVPADLTALDAVTSTVAGHAAARIETADLRRELGSRVFGQDSALDALASRAVQHVRRISPRRPATLFALGPTGVGKTSAALALAESLGTLLDGRWSSFIRLNMNEYAERHRVSQLLGAPPSYVGYGDATPLTHGLAAQPESIVLFDEIDKAHPDILVTLMSAMDVGELPLSAAAANGGTVDCRRAIFFFTSNVDVSAAITELDAAGTGASAAATCRRHLTVSGIRPELVGRISSFLVFRPLSERARAEIATAAVAKVAAEYGLQVTWVAPEVVSLIVSRPQDNLGARPDEYYIDELLGPEFSRYATDGGQPEVRIEAAPEPACRPAAASQGLQGARCRGLACLSRPGVPDAVLPFACWQVRRRGRRGAGGAATGARGEGEGGDPGDSVPVVAEVEEPGPRRPVPGRGRAAAARGACRPFLAAAGANNGKDLFTRKGLCSYRLRNFPQE